MKVALLSDCYLPRLGGIEVQVHDLARHLREAGHEVEAFTATRSASGQRQVTEVIDGVPVHRLAIPLPGDLPVNPFAPPELRRRLRSGGFDAAHVHMGVVSPFGMDSVRVLLGLGLPTAVTWHCVLAWAAPAVRTLGYVGRWSRRGVALSAVSAVAAEPLHRMVGPDVPVTVLPNGIDVRRWTPVDREPNDVVRVVTAMRLAARKRPVQLLEVMHRARELAAGVDLRLEVLGEGPQRGGMERWVAEHDAAGWVNLPGRLPREHLHDEYVRSDLYIAPAELEAFGIAALEARTTGLPVVGPKRSGISEFVQDGVNGLLVDDDSEMAGAIARLAREAALRERMRAHNVHTQPDQAWPTVVEQTIALYERAERHAAAR
ncbi:glycosyltransferase family 4 protein [Luteipulveratus flavus]|uniref:D-inositol 3-phosphate glycosyltransferase n=1 Tax=Luteipulveratus flavus TaxID=3031728 RepID=A0ABT6C3B4_9MICO|nr:glycosyltransferase family 4 protein [Luteipulveratus sp. YIM 133296]MDF8263136.1 glycosyltransferase family 4 protein [Luteipulveratus sp. YIM 133296]